LYSPIPQDQGFGQVSWGGGALIVRSGLYPDPIIIHHLAFDPSCPEAEFQADPTAGQIPLAVDFTDLSLGNVTEWSWSFGDGTTSSEQNPSHTYSLHSGPQTVSLITTGPGGVDRELRVGYIDVQTNASVAMRNGSGINPAVFTSVNLPVLNTSWHSLIETGAPTGPVLGLVTGRRAPLEGLFLPAGEILVDVSGRPLFTLISDLPGGGREDLYLHIPNAPSLIGLDLYTQGAILGGPAGLQLCNALDIVLGI
jgi:hypothetical protein